MRKKDKAPAPEVPVTATPAPEAAKNDGNLVNMQQSPAEDEIKNVLGTKTETAAKLVLVNKLGDDVEAVYVRPHPTDEDYDDGEWGEDLVKGKFVLKDGDKAVYYYEKDGAKEYDVRVVYKDAERYENYFRKLPFSSITQLTLRMDGRDESALPFATYLKQGGGKEISTLNEVKKRLGLLDEDDTSGENTTGEQNDQKEENTGGSHTDNNNNNTGNDQNGGDTQEPAPGTDNNGGDTNGGGDDGNGGSNPVNTAEGFIGSSLEDLYGVFGSPEGSDYQDEPETGKTGYHYYDVDGTTFTVSTIVDENGNEIVSGVM